MVLLIQLQVNLLVQSNIWIFHFTFINVSFILAQPSENCMQPSMEAYPSTSSFQTYMLQEADVVDYSVRVDDLERDIQRSTQS